MARTKALDDFKAAEDKAQRLLGAQQQMALDARQALQQARAQLEVLEREAHKNVFTIFPGSHKCLFRMGCKAQCAVHSPAMDKRCMSSPCCRRGPRAADRPKRHLPEGLE